MGSWSTFGSTKAAGVVGVERGIIPNCVGFQKSVAINRLGFVL